MINKCIYIRESVTCADGRNRKKEIALENPIGPLKRVIGFGMKKKKRNKGY